MHRLALTVAAALWAAAVAPQAATAAGYLVTATWGTAGTGYGQLMSPKGVDVAADGSVYVADFSNDTIIQYTADGEVVRAWGGRGSAAGLFYHPSRLALGPDGSVYVTDADNHRIQRFSATGRLLDVWGSKGSRPGQFCHPRGIDVADDGSVYVTDQRNARVQVFTANGRYLRSWGSRGGGRGQFHAPKDIAVGPGGRVYVVDAVTDRVQVFTCRGRWLDWWGGHGTAPGRLDGPRGVTVDARGHVFVADAMNCRLQEFRAGGSLVRFWGAQGTLAGLFAGPRDIAVAGDGSLVAVDTGNHRLQRFSGVALDDNVSPSTVADQAGWSQAPVQVSLASGDDGSGVSATYVRVGRASDFAPYTEPVSLASEGLWRVQYFSVDAAGNQERIRTRVVGVDWTAPIVHVATGLRAGVGRRVTVACVVADNLGRSCRIDVRLRRNGVVVRHAIFGRRPADVAGSELCLRLDPLAGGRYAVEITATDAAHNRGAATSTLVVR